MLLRPHRPRYRRPPCPYPPRPRHDGYQEDFPMIHPSRQVHTGPPPLRGRVRPGLRPPGHPPRRLLPPHPQRPQIQRPPPQTYRPPSEGLRPPHPHSSDYYRDAYRADGNDSDPYNTPNAESQEFYDPYNLDSGE